MEITIQDQEVVEQNLVIESITLLDGVTPDPDVQYKVGRAVEKVIKREGWTVAKVYYNESRYWKTFVIEMIENSTEKLVFTDSVSIYTFSKVQAEKG